METKKVFEGVTQKLKKEKGLVAVLVILLAAKVLIIVSINYMEPQGAAMYWESIPDVPRMVLALGYQWDSVHYVQISEHGYPKTETRTMLYSFSPLYPLLIRIITPIAGNPYLAGIIIANLFSLAAVCMFYRFACIFALPSSALKAALLFALFPTNLVYGTIAYSEAPYLFFAITSLFYQYKRKYNFAALFITLAVLTRSIGLMLIPLQLVMALYYEYRKSGNLVSVMRKLAWFSLPALAVTVLFLYYQLLTNDFLVLFHSGGHFGDTLRTPWYQYKDLTSGFFAFLNPDLDLQYAAFERYVFTLPFLILTILLFRIDWKLALYGCAFMYVTLSMTGIAAAASPRIMLASWVTFIVFKVRMPSWITWTLGILFAAIGVWVMYKFQTALFI